MLKFPFYSFSAFLLLFAIIGLFALSTGIYQLIKGDDREGQDTFRSGMSVFVGFIFLLAGSIFSVENFWSTYNFRNINISQVKSLRVIKSEDEYINNNSNFVMFNDTESIQNVLKSLKNCNGTSRNHESYQDGYKFQIIFTDENLGQDFYISIYRKSKNIKETTREKLVVIPHYYENKNLNLGEFSCPAFQNWVTRNIDPLFQNKENLSK